MEYNEIEKIICEYFNVEQHSLYGQRGQENVTNARFYLWYILHYDMNLSVNRIAKIYNKTPRNISYAIAKIKDGITYQPYYKNIYKELKKTPTL